MAQRESKRSRDIMKALRAEGWFCFKVHGGASMRAGLPDVIVCAEGYFIGLETKHDETREGTSVTQDLVQVEINAAGGHAQVATSKEEAVQVVRDVIRRRRSGAGAS